MLQWVMRSEEAGGISFYIHNKSTETLLLKIDIELRDSTHKGKWCMHRLFASTKSWGYRQFITKDVLDNQMNTLIDRNDHLNIHLKICCKRHIL